MNKKGISAVVATVLIVLLAVVAVVIVWAVLKPALTKTAGQVSAGCLGVDLSIDSATCSDNSATVVVTLTSGKADKVRVVVTNGTGSESDTKDAPETLATKTYTLTYSLTGDKTVRAAPVILLEDGTEKVCENYVERACQ